MIFKENQVKIMQPCGEKECYTMVREEKTDKMSMKERNYKINYSSWIHELI